MKEFTHYLENLSNCPFCKETLSSAKHVLSNNGFNIIECQGCGMSLVNPRPGKEVIQTFYPEKSHTHSIPVSSFKNKIREKIFIEAGRYPSTYRNFFEQLLCRALAGILRSQVNPIIPYRGGGKLLDVGCGNGDFLRLVRTAGWDTYGVDVDIKALKAAKNGYHKLICGTLDSIGFSSFHFDAITILNVLEHCHDPLQVLKNCNRILKHDGIIVVCVPNFECLELKIFEADWMGIQNPLHLFHFNLITLSEMLKCAGFEIVDIKFKIWSRISELESYSIWKKKYAATASFWSALVRRPFVVRLRKLMAIVRYKPVSQIAPFITVYARKDKAFGLDTK